MLVLSRNVGEGILIDNKVFVTNLGINEKGEMVLGFEAPESIPIDRYEVHMDKKKRVKNKNKSRNFNNRN